MLWLLQAHGECMQDAVTWSALKERERRWLLLSNPSVAKQKRQAPARHLRATPWKSGQFFSLSVILSLLSTALDFCGQPVLFKDLAFIQSLQSHASYKK